MRVLVCGGRDYKNEVRVFAVLDAVHRKHIITCIIEGGAKGADRCAAMWARSRGVTLETYDADWDQFGQGAGYRRNAQMLAEGKPDHVIAFPRANGVIGVGTADMIRQSIKAGLKPWEPDKPPDVSGK